MKQWGQVFNLELDILIGYWASLAERSQRHLNRLSLKKLFEGIELQNRAKRNKVIVDAVYKHGYSQREVADFLNLHYSTVSVVVSGKD